MGRAKQAMMEAEDYIWKETIIKFKCPECGKISDGYDDIPQTDKDFSHEIDTSIVLQCIWCDESFDAVISMSVNECAITFDEYPETKVDFDPVFFPPYIDDDWMEEDYYFHHPDKPYNIFISSHDDVVSFIQNFGDNANFNAINRMIFAHSFSIFETYLCDTFLNLIFYNEDNQNLLMKQYNKLKKMTFSIPEMVAQRNLSADEIIKKKITRIIKETSFHNLEKIIPLFQIYQIDIFEGKESKALLLKAVEYRHHCVHRNGHDLDGNQLNVYTKDYNLNIASAMLETAGIIEENIEKKIIEKLNF